MPDDGQADDGGDVGATTRTNTRRNMVDAVLPLVKPRFCLKRSSAGLVIDANVKIKRQCRPGATRWVHPRVPRNGVNTLKLPKEAAHLRVLSSTFGLQDTWLSGRIETATESTRSTYSERNSGPKGHCITRRYTELIRLCFPCNQVASLDVVPDCTPRPPAMTSAMVPG